MGDFDMNPACRTLYAINLMENGKTQILASKHVKSDSVGKSKGCSWDCAGCCQKFSESKYTRSFYTKLQEFYENGEFVDATLRTEDGGCFNVHRIVLSGESDYFLALFSSNINQQRKRNIQIFNVSSDLLEIAIYFIYTREVCLSISNVTEILRVADYLGIVELKKLCEDYIASQIHPKNVIGIYKFAQQFFCDNLKAKSKKFIMKNFATVSQTSEEILDLSVKDVLSILGSEELNVKNEETVWLAALRWINHNSNERKFYILDLIKQVRTGLMDTTFFVENVKDHPFVSGNETVKPVIIQTLRFLYDLEIVSPYLSELTSASNSEIAKPRLPHDVIFAVGGWSGSNPVGVIETYDTRADRWREIQHDDPTGLAYHGAISIGNSEILIIGGFDGIDYFNTTRAFHVVSKTWRNLAPMISMRCYIAVVKMDKQIYVMGGYDGYNRLNTVERYNLSSNQWTLVEPMNSQRSDASATVYNGKIWIVGGFNGVECLQCGEMFDPNTRQWTYISSMRNRRSGVQCISFHGYIYVLGGFNGISRLRTGEKYNPSSGAWSPIPDMYNPRSNFSCVIIDDMLFCIGGFNGVTTVPNVECYDAKNREWYEATDMNVSRSALACCIMTDLPNIHDYIHQNREFLVEERRQRLHSAHNAVQYHTATEAEIQ